MAAPPRPFADHSGGDPIGEESMKTRKLVTLCLVALLTPLLLLACTEEASTARGRIAYPETATVEHTDTYHGVQVADPYRWLEEDVREMPGYASGSMTRTRSLSTISRPSPSEPPSPPDSSSSGTTRSTRSRKRMGAAISTSTTTVSRTSTCSTCRSLSIVSPSC